MLLAIFYTPVAWSQCSGVSTGGGCVPPPCTPGSPLPCNQTPPQGQQQVAPPPQAIWADRWGALAYDDKNGETGTAESQQSKSEANQLSLASCANRGGSHCQILISFHNQCAAVAAGKTWGYSVGPDKETAEKMALMRCSQGDACNVVYSRCSYAERVR
jgi:hypothetical protein